MAVFDILAKLRIDKGDAESSFNSFGTKSVESIESVNKKLKELSAARDKATDTATVHKFNEEIKHLEGSLEKAKGQTEGIGGKLKEAFNPSNIVAFASGGLFAGGIESAFESVIDKAREMDDASDTMSIALTRTTLSSAEQAKEFERLAGKAAETAEAFGLPEDQITSLQAKIVGFSGITGESLDRLTEISLGAANVLQMAPEAIAKLIAKSADPEQEATLSKLGIVFEKNATAAEKMAIIEAKLGPSIDVAKQASQDAFGTFDRMKNSIVETSAAVGLGFLGALHSTFGFIKENKTSVALLAAGIGIVAISSNSAAIGTTALTIAQRGQAIATGIVTGAQTLLNTVMAANPIVLIVAGLAALAAGAIYLYNNVKPVHDAFDSVWTVLKATGAFIGAFVSNEIGALVAGFKGVGKVIDGIVHLDLDKVKEGASEVGGAVAKHVTSGIVGVNAFNKSLAESGEAGKTAGAKTSGGFDEAKKALAALKAELSGLGAAFDEETKSAKEGLDKNISQITALQRERKTAHGDRLKEIDAELAAANKTAREEQQTYLKNTHDREAVAKRFSTEQNNQHVDLLAKIKQEADAEAKKLEISLRLSAAQNGLAFSAADELAVAQKHLDVMQQQFGLLKNVSKETRQKFQLEFDTEQTKILELKAKVSVDRVKIQDDLQKSIDSLTLKEIEVGIRPKSDTLLVLNDQLTRIEEQIAQKDFTLSLLPPGDEFDRVTTDLNNLKAAHQSAQQAITTFEKDQANERIDNQIAIVQAQIDAMEDGVQKEELALTLAFQQQLRADGDNAELRKAHETKFQRELLAIKSKAAKDEISLSFVTQQGILSLYKDITAQKQKLSDLEIDQQRHKLDVDRTSIEASLQRGELSQQEYSLKIRDLQQQQSDFEQKLREENQSQFAKSLADRFDAVQASVAADLEAFIAGEVAKVLQAQITQAALVAAQLAGDAQMIASLTARQATEESANATTLTGMIVKIVSAWAGGGPLGWLAGLGAALAAEGAVIALASTASKAVRGLDRGGMFTMVGEKRPEFIGATEDFSQFSSKLAADTAKATEKAVRQNGTAGGGAGSNGKLNVKLTGGAKLEARTLKFGLDREAIARQNESLSLA